MHRFKKCIKPSTCKPHYCSSAIELSILLFQSKVCCCNAKRNTMCFYTHSQYNQSPSRRGNCCRESGGLLKGLVAVRSLVTLTPYSLLCFVSKLLLPYFIFVSHCINLCSGSYALYIDSFLMLSLHFHSLAQDQSIASRDRVWSDWLWECVRVKEARVSL